MKNRETLRTVTIEEAARRWPVPRPAKKKAKKGAKR